jgi:hypothetical protein
MESETVSDDEFEMMDLFLFKEKRNKNEQFSISTAWEEFEIRTYEL